MTKKIVLVLMIAFAISSFAQTYTTVSASAVKDKNGALITGTIQFIPDRQFGWTGVNPAGCCQKDVPLIATLTAGAFSLPVPRASAITPAGVCFSVIAKNAAGNVVLGPSGYNCLQPSGATYNFDAYVPGTVPVPVTPTAVVPTDCNIVSSGYVIQKVNPDGTVVCAPASGGSGSWGTITGTLSSQTDLNTALGLLAPIANPTFTGTVAGVTASMVGLGSVTNDVQTKAAIVPNTPPAAGDVLVGNAGGTAYAHAAMSGDATLASTGAATLATVNSNVGSIGDSTHSLTLNIDAKGRILSATANVISGLSLPSTLTAGAATGVTSQFKLTDTINNTGTGFIFDVTTASGSAANLIKLDCGAGSTASRVWSQRKATVEKASLDCDGNASFASLSFIQIASTNSAAPGTPVAGNVTEWTDSTHKRFHDINDAGVIGTTVTANSCSAGNHVSAVSTSGVVSCSADASGGLTTDLHAGTSDILCANIGDCATVATAETAFATTSSVATALNGSGKSILLLIGFDAVANSSPNVTFKVKWGSVVIYQGTTDTLAGTGSAKGGGLMLIVTQTAAVGASVACITGTLGNGINDLAPLGRNTVTASQNLVTNSNQNVSVTLQYAAGTAGNTVTLTHLDQIRLN